MLKPDAFGGAIGARNSQLNLPTGKRLLMGYKKDLVVLNVYSDTEDTVLNIYWDSSFILTTTCNSYFI